MKLVVDASVAFKWFSAAGEDSVEEALELLERHRVGELTLVAPPIMAFEVLNALRSARVSPAALDTAAGALAALEIEAPCESGKLLEMTGRLISERDLTAYDASYAALAALLDCPLVTADRKAFGSTDAFRVQML